MKIPVWCDQTGRAFYRGGFADVWKGKYRNQDVVMKVLRTYSTSDLQKVIGVGCWLPSLFACQHANRACVEILQGSHDMENASASERAAADRSDDVRDSLRNDIELDGERKHQRLREGTPGCKPFGAGGSFNRSLAVFAAGSPMTG